jgi:hypothetical protein
MTLILNSRSEASLPSLWTLVVAFRRENQIFKQQPKQSEKFED